jgi:hypothetical protein
MVWECGISGDNVPSTMDKNCVVRKSINNTRESRMESQIETIVSKFATNIQKNIISITQMIKTIKEKIQILRETYVDLIEKNNHKQIFLFCLESFNFQNKTMMYEVDHLQKTFNMLLNRTYRDYYKLYNIILKLFEEYKLENKTQKTHPEYRDLDINAEFSLEEISEIHNDVIYLTCVLIDKYKESEEMIRQYKTKSKTGIYIINLINTIEYDNAILKDQIDLYINYLLFFQDTQTTYLSKLKHKTDNFLKEIDNDITFKEEEPNVEELNTEEPKDDLIKEEEQKKNEKKDEQKKEEPKKDEPKKDEPKKEEPKDNNLVSGDENNTVGIDSSEMHENIGIIVYENPLNSETQKIEKRRGRRI